MGGRAYFRGFAVVIEPPDKPAPLRVTAVPRIADIPAAAWDACANPDPAAFNPFVSHAFLDALEKAGTTGARAGWIPRHIAILDGHGGLKGCLPCYVKTHSQGEYVFDHAWAEAYEQAGGRYYPKLQAAVPFTPVPGPRLLVKPGPDAATCEASLAAAAVELARQGDFSSLHVTFLTEPEWTRLGGLGFLQRTGQQFHWRNRGYGSFEDFLGALASRKRKMIRRERRTALEAGVEIEHVTGQDIGEAHWDAVFAFYMDTGSRKWGQPYLNRRFFSLLGESMPERCLLVLAKRAGRYVAGALNLIGGDCLHGRYWGMIEHHPCLHFELCYYQAIEWAIARGLPRVEAGAQGEHKLARGYEPTVTYSAHWIADPRLRDAVAGYLAGERRHIENSVEALREFGPFRHDETD